MENLYDKDYFVGKTKSNYDDYANCKGLMGEYAQMLNLIFNPGSVFDAGGAYGHVVDWFNDNGCVAQGIDISEWASSHSTHMMCGEIKSLYNNEYLESFFDLVTCTEVMEHITEEDTDLTLKTLHYLADDYVVLLVAFGEEGVPDPNDISHINMHPKEWWENKIKELGYQRDLEKESELNNHQLSIAMNWTNRFLVIKKGGK